MAIQVSIQNINAFDNIITVSGLLLVTGNYVAGGDTIDFTKAVADPGFTGLTPVIPSSGPPQDLDVWSVGGNLVNQYCAVIGSGQNNSKMKVSAASTFGTEFTAGAYSAAILADTIAFQANFKKFI